MSNHGLYARNSEGRKVHLVRCVSVMEIAERSRHKETPGKPKGTRCAGCGGKYLGTFCRLCHINETINSKVRR